MGVALRRTRRFSVIERDAVALPRVAAAAAASSEVIRLLRERGYVIVTALERGLVEAVRAQERAFLEFYGRSEARKERCVGTVYLSERGQPMFARGYERQARVRECFRSQAAAPEAQPWPSREARGAWVDLVGRLGALADAVLDTALGDGPRPEGGRSEDFSLAYSFLYGVDDGGANGGCRGTLVGEHADVSLVVVEPVSRVPGLEVFDRGLRRWVRVEEAAAPGEELVLFGGKALEHWTGIPACRHRVVKCAPPRTRHVFLFEQKYAAFFDHVRPYD